MEQIDIDRLNRSIEANVYENENGEISGEGLQVVLKDMTGSISHPVNAIGKEADTMKSGINANAKSISDTEAGLSRLTGRVSRNEEAIGRKADRVELAETDRQLLELSDRMELGEGGIASNAKSIAENAQAIAGKADNATVSRLSDKVEKNRLAIAKTETAISDKAESSEISRLEGRIFASEQSIQANADSIAKKADSSSIAGLGNGIESNRNEISALKAEMLTKQEKMTAGNGISIKGNEVSATYSQFDATDLYRSLNESKPISEEFYLGLQDAIARRDLLYIYDTLSGGGFVHFKVVYIADTDSEMIFSAFNGRISFILKLDEVSRMVSLDTERIGAEFSIFNNKSGNNIFNLMVGASVREIIEVFTDARGEERIPDSGDIFNVWENSNLAQSGIVVSRTEDEASLDIQVFANDIVKEYTHILHLKFDYNAGVGMDSLKVTERNESIIDWKMLDHNKQFQLAGEVQSLKEGMEGRASVEDINCYNISAIRGSAYASEGEAISALNGYLLNKPKSIGLEMVYVGTDRQPKKYIFVGGSGGFTNPVNWKPIKY